MKMIGVLGGLGPQATMDFEVRVHQESQRRIPPRMNGGYPPMIVHYHRRPPFRLKDDGLPRLPIEPDPDLLQAAGRLGAFADFLVITSNGPHLIQDDIERASGKKVLSMIDVTLDEVRRRGWKRVGMMGLDDPFVYTRRLDALGIAYEILEPERRTPLDGAIFRLMEGRDDDEGRRLAREAVDRLRGRCVEGIILGCTELPVLRPNCVRLAWRGSVGYRRAQHARRQASGWPAARQSACFGDRVRHRRM
jgi:aspartate racemase